MKALYPGTFDPVTYGHIDLIKRALLIFDEIVIGVAQISPKETLFSLEERVGFLEQTLKDKESIQVRSFSSLAIDFARELGTTVLIRGLRMVSDFEYEFQMALTNRKLAPEIETIFLMPKEDYSYISSSLLKQISRTGGDVSSFVPPEVEQALKKKA